MRRSRFEQLVNLYLDGEITKPELRCLRREVLRCPRRRSIFAQYCKLHKATCKARLAPFEELVRCRSGGQSDSFSSWFSYASVGAAAAVLVLGVASLSQLELFFSSPGSFAFAEQEQPLIAPPLEVTPPQDTERIDLLTEQEFEQFVLQDILAREESWEAGQLFSSGQPVRLTPTLPFGAKIDTSAAGGLIVDERTPFNGFQLINNSRARLR